MSAAVRFGVNYTPSVGWFHHWLDFDLDAVRADLDSIAALGLDHIRVFPLWPYFQPNRTLIRERAVTDLVRLVDAAAERGLDVTARGAVRHYTLHRLLPDGTRRFLGGTCQRAWFAAGLRPEQGERQARLEPRAVGELYTSSDPVTVTHPW
ncbi:hypothetical protein RKD20_001001 [Streptomyces sp. SLBN-8D4]|jgi:hypothetical protein